ncbi:MAG: PaaI family thioesterase [Polaromonas sp.]|uniref:PaaI family thioesterase n=1 Tax=Polaromonas sp. TaxID=1869339 RepID=UPI0024891E90|nr:PaaI family thioesterase [Polaromonas sp.]MDI1238229.1 PaaI family thioesterase [Polaromonas sp.]MDI1341872.1 PaaI family thioesterase [Polaromonas sp.]
MDETLLLQKGQAFLALQPFSVLIGAELHALSTGKCELHVPVTPHILQQNGFVHGGVVSYAADNALTYAGGTVLDWAVVTSEFKINYVRPAIGERLIARAEVVHAGKSQAVCRCDVFVVAAGQEKLCAVAQGTIVRLPGQAGAT